MKVLGLVPFLLFLAACQHSTTKNSDVTAAGIGGEKSVVMSLDDSTRAMVISSGSTGILVREQNGVCEEAKFSLEKRDSLQLAADQIYPAEVVDLDLPVALPTHWNSSDRCSQLAASAALFSVKQMEFVLLAVGPQVEVHPNLRWGVQIIPFELRVGSVHASLSLGNNVGVIIDVRDHSIVGVSSSPFDAGTIHSVFADDSDDRIGRVNLELAKRISDWDHERAEHVKSSDLKVIAADPDYGNVATQAHMFKILTDLGVL